MSKDDTFMGTKRSGQSSNLLKQEITDIKPENDSEDDKDQNANQQMSQAKSDIKKLKEKKSSYRTKLFKLEEASTYLD